jgi:hypothetical protein
MICCIKKGCSRIGRVRGLCSACYTIARDRIRAGKITEQELVRRGELLPKADHRRYNNSR